MKGFTIYCSTLNDVPLEFFTSERAAISHARAYNAEKGGSCTAVRLVTVPLSRASLIEALNKAGTDGIFAEQEVLRTFLDDETKIEIYDYEDEDDDEEDWDDV